MRLLYDSTFKTQYESIAPAQYDPMTPTHDAFPAPMQYSFPPRHPQQNPYCKSMTYTRISPGRGPYISRSIYHY